MTRVTDVEYRMTLSLHVLNELGVNLYSNVPAVLAEVVANSWDADATNVQIKIDTTNRRIVITDDGRGMLVNDEVNEINDRYLRVGYHRRAEKDKCNDKQGNSITPKFRRPVMGRKGIGKLSLFAIADEFQVHTAKDRYKAGFIMSSKDIKTQIKDDAGIYNPRAIPSSEIEIDHGTRIILTDLKKGIKQADQFLQRRLARRFGIRGSKYNFKMFINNNEVLPQHRDYFNKIQYLWEYGESDPTFKSQCINIAESFERHGDLGSEQGYSVSGWIGTAHRSGQLKEGNESINKIVIFVREKLAQEDILEEFGEGGVYANYVFGEIFADFLDIDSEDDIATSSRQKIIEDDPRYIALKTFIGSELKKIQGKWTDLRNSKGLDVALQIPAINSWFDKLGPDHRRKARALFGKINQLNLEDEQRKVLLQNGVIAFETLRHKEQLDRLESLSAEDISAIRGIFYDLDDLEATLYHRIVQERLKVISALKESVEDNNLEKALQEHIFSHLWLLDPSWERATENVPSSFMERSFKKMFEEENALKNLKPDQLPEGLSSRVDIKYTTAQGKDVIVELKRPDRRLSFIEIHEQLRKYRTTYRNIAKQSGNPLRPLELICIIGTNLKEWEDSDERDEATKSLDAINARVVTYQQLIAGSEANYMEFLKRHRKAGRITELIRDIGEWEWGNGV